jgi:hypothetical protein
LLPLRQLQEWLVSITILDDPPLSNEIGDKNLPVFTYLLGAKLTLKDGYYRPSSGSEPTLDSFIYESATETASVIQSTVSPKHTMCPKGLEWLQSLGVTTFRYIVVSSPGESVDLPFLTSGEPRNLSSLRSIFLLLASIRCDFLYALVDDSGGNDRCE